MSKSFTVIWKRQLIEEATPQWLLAARERGEDAQAITDAMAEIDRLLASSPRTQGESRPPYERILIIPPLVVTYEIHEDERVVSVLSARYRPRRRN